jgi:Transcriptional regulators containing a DNA-binding HTH domain and an aminotransferase domain (MocR family) and their eukaryotic orthologs
MSSYKDMGQEELLEIKKGLELHYKEIKCKKLNLDMTRGKPDLNQLNLGIGMLDVINSTSIFTGEDGVDFRNYGILDGIIEAKRLFADMIDVKIENVLVAGNASLPLMYDRLINSMICGVMGHTPWCKLDKVKFLCPVPGYDRHFAMTEQLGIEMINVPMLADGPDMDIIERLVAEDESIKGIWCVPKYANPTGITYSDAVVRRFAALKPKAKDFRIYWDNAYCIHGLYEDRQDSLLDILGECEKAGNPDLVYIFFSTSKISFSGSGVAGLAASINNLEAIKKQMSLQIVGYDKINQIRHVQFFKDANGLNAHMKKHAKILRPKFDLVLEILQRELQDTGIADYIQPNGGYFISFDAMKNCAKKIVEKCHAVGIKMTAAGATFPYGVDPMDKNIRIAPSYVAIEDLKVAMEVFVVVTKLVSIEKILEARV